MEEKDTSEPRKKRRVAAVVANILAYILVGVFFLVVLAIVIIQTPAGQDFARKKVQNYLQNKLKTKVLIGKVNLRFPTSVSLQNVLIEDQTKDTLISGGQLLVDIDMLKLLKSDVEIKQIRLDNVLLKVKRVGTDTVFNFQFIANAFAGKQGPTSKDTSSVKMNISRILVNNTRVIYKDVITGDDMNMFMGSVDVPIKKFDPSHLIFDIPSFTAKGVKGYYYQNQPLKPKIDSAVAQAIVNPQNALKLTLGVLNISNVDVDYRSVPTDVSTALKITQLVTHPDTLDIRQGRYHLRDFVLNGADIAIQMTGKKQVAKTTNQQQAQDLLPLLTVISDKVAIQGSHFKMDNMASPQVPTGMDYNHLDITDLDVSASNFQMNSKGVTATFNSASLKEKSGFVLNDLKGDFVFSDTKTSFDNLYLKTQGSLIRRKILITYPSLDAVSQNPALLAMDLDIRSSIIQVKDVRTFVPALTSNPALSKPWQSWTLDGRIKGRISDLSLTNVRFSGLQNTSLYVSGTIKGLPDVKKLQADLTIPYLNTTRSDILALVPKNTIPSNITLPQSIHARGRLVGGTEKLYANVNVATSLGAASLRGTVYGLGNPKTMRYNMDIATRDLNLGVILQDQKTFGLLSTNISIQGTGTDIMNSNLKLNGGAMALTYNGYTYHNVYLTGTISKKQYNITARVLDPNAHLTAKASGTINGINSSLKLTANVDSIKAQPLHFTSQEFIYAGKIVADFANINPDALSGTANVTASTVVNAGQRFQVDSVNLYALHTGNNELIRLQTQFMNTEVAGQYKLTQLADIFAQAIEPYYSTGLKKSYKTDVHDFKVTAVIYDHPALHAFLPALKTMDSVHTVMNISTSSGLNGTVDVPLLVYGINEIYGLKLAAETKNNAINITSSFDHYKSGKSINVYATTLNATIANNAVTLATRIKDAKGKDKYSLTVGLNKISDNNFTVTVQPQGLLLNYKPWTVSGNNQIVYNNGSIISKGFVLSQGSQQLTLSSTGPATNPYLNINLKEFEIATITAFVQSDTLLVNGSMNGNLVVKNLKQNAITADLTVNDLSINKDTLGNVVAKVNNTTGDTYAVDVRLTGKGNDVAALGTYSLSAANGKQMDLTLNVNALQMATLEGASMNAIRNASGNVSGKIAVSGTLSNPDVDGNLRFNNAAFNLSILNNYFRIDNQNVAIDNSGFSFDNFVVKDSANNELTLDGSIITNNFSNYLFDLSITSDNFQFLNTTKKDNKLYYGKVLLSTDLYIYGTMDEPIVDGSVTVNDKTAFSIVLPQNEVGIEKTEGIVQFVNVKATSLDSLFMQPYDSLNVSKLQGFDVSINIEVDKNAQFNLIVDEGNGDFINLKGEALLTAGIDPSGKITLIGSYEISEGAYQLTFNFLKRRFDIQKGSKIVWTGEPTNADLNVSAVYVADASPIDLVQDQISEASNIIKNTYRQKLPFQVWLTLTGQIMKPQIGFDIRLPEDQNYNVSKDIINNVEYRLAELKSQPSELNKQVFALILLNRFVGEDPFNSSGSGGVDAAGLVMSSVSKMLGDQLNQLAKGLIQGVDINFDLVSTEDYTTGEKRNRTDFNVGLSKRLLNDRLTVTVGSNFELQGPKQQNQANNNMAGNVAIDYKISRDGRYLLRVYRRNNFEGIIEGYIIETGVGFIMNVDYNQFNEVFRRKSKPPKTKKSDAADDKQKTAALNK